MTKDKTTQEAGFNERMTTFRAARPVSNPHNVGHRDRLRARFADAPSVIRDYELLELLLFRSIPRADTKTTANNLLKRFGTFSAVLGAPERLIAEVDGAGPAAARDLKIIEEAAKRVAKNEFKDQSVLDAWSKVINYCQTAMASETREQFRILFLNKKNQLIADEVQHQGTVDHTPAYPREVVRRALELSATAIILAHNHPSGDSTPSRADIEMTARIVEAAKPVNILVHDHIIVGKNGATSLRGLDLM